MKPFDFNSGRATARDTVVLLHSSASSSRQWSALMERLGPCCDVRALDFHGRGRRPASDREVPALADEAALVEPLLREGKRVHLLGHSYGGAVALKVAALHPQAVASVAVYEPVLFRWLLDEDANSGAVREVVEVVDAIRKFLDRGDAYRAAGRFLNYWSGAGAWESTSPKRRDVLAGRMRDVLAHFDALFRDELSASDLRRATVPMLFLSGGDTVASTRRIAALLEAALPAAQHRVLAGIDHMGPVSYANEVNAELLAFLAGAMATQPSAGVLAA